MDFSLAVWKEYPEAGQGLRTSQPTTETAKITNIVNATIYGGSNQVIASALNSDISMAVTPYDFASLRRVLSESGVPDPEIDALEIAVTEESVLGEKGEFGPKVAAWLGNALTKASRDLWGVGVNVGTSLLTSALMRYYGLPN